MTANRGAAGGSGGGGCPHAGAFSDRSAPEVIDDIRCICAGSPLLRRDLSRRGAIRGRIGEIRRAFAVPVIEIVLLHQHAGRPRPPPGLLHRRQIDCCAMPTRSRPTARSRGYRLEKPRKDASSGQHIPQTAERRCAHCTTPVHSGQHAGGPAEPTWRAGRFRHSTSRLSSTMKSPQARHDANRAASKKEQGDDLTVARLAGLVAEICGDKALIINETQQATRLRRQGEEEPDCLTKPVASRYGLPAALGAKLARPNADVIAFKGDGCYVFGSPSARMGARPIRRRF